MLIPFQMAISLAIALMLDIVTTRFARFSRLMIFLPYAIPAVIGALMWGFLYSKNFGPIADFFGAFGATGPDFLSKDLIFFGLLNVVTWQWAGYYMIILYAALQGIDPTLYEAARIDGASQWQIILRIKIPLIAPALVLILVFALIGTLQFFNEPQILRYLAAGRHPEPTSRPTCTRINRRSRWRTTTTARRSRSRSAPSCSSASTSSCSPLASEGASSHERHPSRRAAAPASSGRFRCRSCSGCSGHLLPRSRSGGSSSTARRARPDCSAAATRCGSPTTSTTSATSCSCSPTAAASTRAGWSNSALYAFVGGIGATVLAVLAGYGFAKFRFAGRRLGFAILLGAVMVPTTALVIPTFILFSQAGITNTIWAVILPTLLNPFGVYLMNVYARDAVPDELLDAARVDGAGEFRTLPAGRAAADAAGDRHGAAAVDRVVVEQLLPAARDALGQPPVPGHGRHRAVAGHRVDLQRRGRHILWSIIILGSLVSVIPLIIAFLSLQRYWRGGLAIGSLK